jgi:hypothetical protein
MAPLVDHMGAAVVAAIQDSAREHHRARRRAAVSLSA